MLQTSILPLKKAGSNWETVIKRNAIDVLKAAEKNYFVKNRHTLYCKNGNKPCLQNQMHETLWLNPVISMTWLVNHVEPIGRNRDALLFVVDVAESVVGVQHSISDPCGWIGIFYVLDIGIPNGPAGNIFPCSSDCHGHTDCRSSPGGDNGHNGRDEHLISSALGPTGVKDLMDLLRGK